MTLMTPQNRRQTRERREYIFKKSQESQERAIYERKQRIKELLAAGKPLPTDLRNEAKQLGGKDLVLDEAQAGEWRRQPQVFHPSAHLVEPGTQV